MVRRGIRTPVLVALAALMTLATPTPARAGGLADGLAVAVTADGSRLVAGGSNRVLYELDPATLEVRRRVWLGRQIMAMQFSPDGKVLVVESTKVVQWLKADTLEPFHTLKDAERIRPVPALDGIAVNVRGFEPAIKVLAFGDAAEKANVPYDRRTSVAAWGISPDGKKLAILYYRRRDDGEEKVAWKDIPEELRKDRESTALLDFQQRHDGYGAAFHVVNVATAKPIFEKQLFYTVNDGNHLVAWHGEDVHVIGYSNQCAKIDPQGEVMVYRLANGYNYAYAATPDGKVFWTGGLRDGCRTKVADLSRAAFEIDELEGFPEYFKHFTIAADGTAYAGTTAFRVVRLGTDGKIGKVAPVY